MELRVPARGEREVQRAVRPVVELQDLQRARGERVIDAEIAQRHGILDETLTPPQPAGDAQVIERWRMHCPLRTKREAKACVCAHEDGQSFARFALSVECAAHHAIAVSHAVGSATCAQSAQITRQPLALRKQPRPHEQLIDRVAQGLQHLAAVRRTSKRVQRAADGPQPFIRV